jgi:hypothetical protein
VLDGPLDSNARDGFTARGRQVRHALFGARVADAVPDWDVLGQPGPEYLLDQQVPW